MSTNVDARGLACPQPVIATKKALAELTTGVVTTLVDNVAAKENVVKFAVTSGCGVSVEEKDGYYIINITKDGTAAPQSQTAPATAVAAIGPAAYLITKDTLGSGDEKLGAILIKSFFSTLLETEPLPRTIMFINSGVKLAVAGSPVLDQLQTLAGRGVEFLACGTCLDFFQLKDRLAVGAVTNMYTILTETTQAVKVVTL